MTNPLRFAALVQGYPVRPPFSPASAGDMRLWFDASDASTLLNSSGSPTTGAPARIKDITSNSLDFAVSGVTQVAAPTGLTSLRFTGPTAYIRKQTTLTTQQINDLTDRFNFLHSTESNMFAVLKWPGTSNADTFIYLANTAAGTSAAGMYVIARALRPFYTKGVVLVRVFRGVQGTYNANVETIPIVTFGSWVVVHVTVKPTATASERVRIRIPQVAYEDASNTASSNASTADSFTTFEMSVNSGGASVAVADVGELMIFQGAVSDGDASTIRNYLKSKWIG